MIGASACGWIRTSLDATTVMPVPSASSPSWVLLGEFGGEPSPEHVHRRFCLRHGDALAQTGFHEERRPYRGGVAHRRDGDNRRESGNRQPDILPTPMSMVPR